jgi:ABC-type Fe3+ transport system substrate-binding protein
MKRLSLLIAAATLLMACQSDERQPIDAGEAPALSSTDWETLFSGDDLKQFDKIGDADWKIVGDYVEDVDGDAGFLVSKNHYRDFELHVEFWPSPDANSGVFLRCQDATDVANETCYELNIYDQHANPDNATGSIINLATPRVAVETGNRWNVYDISVRGSHVVVRLNGAVITELHDQRFAEGPIALQSNGGLIRFRNVRVKPLATEDELWAATVAAAEQEGSVVCACPPVRSLGEFLDAEWSAAFPNIELERTSAVGDWPSRIAIEREAGVFLWDTYFWASSPPIYALKDQGAFVPLLPELILDENSDEAIWGGWDQAFMDEEKQYLLSFRIELSKVAFNASHISPAELTRIEDLFDPRYKGKISIEDPRVTGAGEVFGAWFLQEYGRDAWESLLIDQEVLLAASKDEQAQSLARGPHYIAIPNPGVAGLKPYRDAGMDMDIQYLGHDSDNAFITIAYSVTGIFSKAPHPNAARVFTNWLLSRDIQEKLKRFAHNSRRRDVSPADPDKYPTPGVDYFYPQSEAAVGARQTASALAKKARPN